MSLNTLQNFKEQQAKEVAKTPKKPTLNPPFPYRVTAFQPEVFGVLKDPPKAVKR
jgi:hypothetical protein